MRRLSVLLLLLAFTAAQASTGAWQPGAGHTQIALWPNRMPDAQPMPGPETTTVGKDLIGGRPVTAVTNVSRPTMTVYAPQGTNSGAAVLVIPGGGFQILAMDLEGTEACDWLTAHGVTCVLLKYRVPSLPYDWHCDCRAHNLMVPKPSLQDTQRALALIRHRAAEWQLDPHKVGVMGFSAGGYLVAEASTQYRHRQYAPVDAADRESVRPDFALAIYPGHLTDTGTLNPNEPVTADTPPTFVLQAQDDHVDGVEQALVYYGALNNAGVPAELHIYPTGGHAFGLRRTQAAITAWPDLMGRWLLSIGVRAD